MASLVQAERPMRLRAPLGDDSLVIERLTGSEHVSRPFVLTLDLLSEDPAIDPATLLRKPMGVAVDLADGSQRFFHGLVRRFVQLGRSADQFARYRAELVPRLWFLSASSDCRIFQEKTVPEIVSQIFEERSMTSRELRLALTKSYAKRTYCVQYRETDLTFVSRLLEEEGIFYFFEHEDDEHVLVLADSPGAIKSGPVEKMSAEASGPGTYGGEHIVGLELGSSFFPGAVSLNDYNMETPSVSLVQQSLTRVTGVDNSSFGLYDYPGNYTDPADGDRLARIRMEEQEASSVIVAGTAIGAGLACGTKVEIADFYRRDANKAYLVLSVEHKA